MSAVSLDQVKRRLKVTTNADDDHILDLIGEAEDYVAQFIGGPLEVDGQVPAGIRSAIMQQVAFLYDGTPVDLGGALAPYRAWNF